MQKDPSEILSLFKPYFREILKRGYYCAFFFVVVFLSSFFFSEKIIKFFLGFFEFGNVQIVTTSPFQFFGLAINIAISIAIISTFPIIIYNLFSFISPALTKKEKKNFGKIIFSSIIFFVLGFLFGFNILNYILTILAKYNTKVGLVNMWDVGIFSSQIFLTASFMGIIFQFPVVMTVLLRRNLISLEVVRKKRKWAVLLSFIISALLPPTDGLSLIIIALSLILIFEITLLYNRKAVLQKKSQV